MSHNNPNIRPLDTLVNIHAWFVPPVAPFQQATYLPKEVKSTVKHSEVGLNARFG